MNIIPIESCLRNFAVGASAQIRSLDNESAQTAARAEAYRQGEALGYQAGERDARAQLEAEYELRLSMTIAQAQERMNSEAAQRSDEQSTQWALAAADSLQSSLNRLEKLLASRLAEVLKPLVMEAAQREAIGQIVRDIHRLDVGALTKIKVSGPQILIDKLAQAMPDLKFESAATSTVELCINIDETSLSTRLSDWRKTYLEPNS